MDFNKELLCRINRMGDKSCAVAELARQMNIRNKNDKRRFNQSINNLLRRGLIAGRGKNKIARLPKDAFVKGVLQGNRKGFAFLIRDDKKEDVFISSSMLNGALHGDTVLAVCGCGKEGAVVRIIKRGITSLVGTFIQSGKNGYVVPDMDKYFKDIFVASDMTNGATSMEKVVVSINTDRFNQKPFGEVVQILGKKGEKKAEVLSILRSYGFSDVFPDKVIEEMERIEYKPEKRKDFTSLLTITIDGEDAKDFDDAISLEKVEAGYRLYVHIADVSHYVKAGSQTDKEAFKRGTSVYFPSEAYPMLPEKISCNICSLRPGEDKMTVSVVLDIDNAGKVQHIEMFESIVCSNYRMTYNNVTKILEGDKQLRKRYFDIVSMLEEASKLSELLTQNRKKAGMINFISNESKIELDENGDVLAIGKREETASHKIIEQFMITVNEAVATYIAKKNIPNVYRSHEKISQEKLADFIQFIKSFGYDIDITGGVHPKVFSDLLSSIKGNDAENIINKVMLRAMQKAKYTTKNLGHFGLSLKSYCHFTAPIRRYADLVVHRILKAIINSQSDNKFIERAKNICQKAAIQSTEQEIAAVNAERDVEEYYKALYMENHIGHRFAGTISGVVAMGIFVELDNTVEGFVSIDELPIDRYEMDNKGYCLRGKKHKYTLADKIEVEIKSSNPTLRRIDMTVVDSSIDN